MADKQKHKQQITSKELSQSLMASCNWFSGVPDGAIKGLYEYVKPYKPATREDHALAMAFGARIAGKRPCVIMQNSGLGYCGDVILGLFKLYKQGGIIVVGARGEFSWEEPQHREWGPRTKPLLNALGISWFDPVEESFVYMRNFIDTAFATDSLVAVILRRGVVDGI